MAHLDYETMEPLVPNSHEGPRYGECYAKAVLEELFAEDVGKLELSDAPDLRSRDGRIGIEVTSAKPGDEHLAKARYVEWGLVGKGEGGDDAEGLKRRIEQEIERAGARIEGGVLFGPDGSDGFGLVYEAVRNKQGKLSSGMYDGLEDYRLFVESGIFASEPMLSAALVEISSICRGAEPPAFSTVYVAVPGGVHLFDVAQNERKTVPVSDVLQFELAMRARATMLGGEDG